jgi:hypothetical protein
MSTVRLMVRVFALLGAVVAAPSLVIAQPSLKPGLWEVQMRSPELEAGMKQFREALAAMPPDQRAKMEKMMAEKGGALPGANGMRVCHTAESLRQRGPMAQESGCTTQTQWKSNGGSFEMSCQDGRKGKGEFVMATPDSYTGKFEMSDPKRPGDAFKMEHSARFLGADCGQVKPVVLPPAGKG